MALRHSARMVCLSCRRWNRRDLCVPCRSGLRPGPERLLSFGIVRSGFVHEGPARTLVHRLKYEAMPAAGRVLAGEGMAHLVPPEAKALIPELVEDGISGGNVVPAEFAGTDSAVL